MTRWVPFKGWGDALYISNDELKRNKYPGRLVIYKHKILADIGFLILRLKNFSKFF